MDDNLLAKTITEAIEAHDSTENAHLREELGQIQQQLMALKMEDQGWLSIFGREEHPDGLSLQQVKDFSKILRESVAGSPLPKQANALRYSYTFSKPFIIPELTDAVESPKKTRGRKPAIPRLVDFFADKVNQRYVFGKEAQELVSTACSTDGCYLALGDDKTRKIRPIPIHEIAGVYVDVDFPGEILAYHRQWTTTTASGEQKTVDRWYYTDRFEGKREKTLDSSVTANEKVKVDTEKTMIDFSVNQQVGWTFGVPDLQAGHLWNQKYVTMMNHGEEVSATLAFFAAKVKVQSQAGAKNVGVKMGDRKNKAGSITPYGPDNAVDVFTTAGKTYDFSGLNPVAGVYALSVGVSLVDLLSNPSASGSSYGAAKALDPATRRGIESRRAQIASWLERVILWGTGEPTKVTPASIEEVDPYRNMQMVKLAWDSGLVHKDEARSMFLYLAGLTSNHNTAPVGVLMPNNSKSLPRKDIDTDAAPTDPATPNTPASDGTTPTGGDSAQSNDIRSDLVAD